MPAYDLCASFFSADLGNAKKPFFLSSDISQMGAFVFERFLPDLTKADRGVEAVEDGERHRDVSDDWPRPVAAVELDLGNKV